MAIQTFSKQIMQLIADGKLSEAVKYMQDLLQHSALFSEMIVQSARYNEVIKSIRMGTLTEEQANAEKNKIRYALLDMLRELEEGSETIPSLNTEIRSFLQQEPINKLQIKDSKNVVTGNIKAGGNVKIGDVHKRH